MDNEIRFKRPTFDNALAAWKNLLAERHLPTDCTWIFDDNLCFEKDPAGHNGYHIAFQTRFTPPSPEAEHVAYDYFTGFDLPLVFYRVGTCAGKSVCLLLCDKWFETKQEKDGYLRREPWRILFRPGGPETLEEVVDEPRWRRRVVRDRGLHDLDFCMTLRGVRELLAHGRVLSAYERFALRFLHVGRRAVRPAR